MVDRGLQPWERLWKKAIENILLADWKPTHPVTSMDLSVASTLSLTISEYRVNLRVLSKFRLQNLITNSLNVESVIFSFRIAHLMQFVMLH